MPSTYLIWLSLTFIDTWQPTPQNGQMLCTSRSKSALSPCCASSTTVAGISAPVGQACHAFATGHAGAVAHRVVEIEDRIGVMASPRHADHIVHLNLAAGPHAQPALDAGIQIDGHRHVAVIQKRDPLALQRRKPALGHAGRVRHVPQMRRPVMRFGLCRLVGRSISTTVRRALTLRSFCDCTTMSSVGRRMQDAASTRSPSISTMQARQLPSGRYPGAGLWHRCGMVVPSRCATCQIVSPGAAVTVRPSSVNRMSSAMRETP